MGYAVDQLEGLLKQLHPGDETIATARARRDEVLDIAANFDGGLRTYWSGSIAHHTANFDTDADGGIVLDRRSYPKLGPDGHDVGPEDVVIQVRDFVRKALVKSHPDLRTRLTKRAIQITYHEPVSDDDGADPSVDLIVGLTRRNQPGLWIPNREKSAWNPSHPEKHTELLTAEPKSLRQKRARVIRVVKGWNKQFSEPAVCSFNIEALALQSVEMGVGFAESLLSLLEYGERDLKRRQTPDPAGVSPPIKTLVARQQAADRFGRAASQLREALDNDDDECKALAALFKMFWKYIEPCESDKTLRDSLTVGGSNFTTAGVVATSASGRRQRTTRSYGRG